MRGLLLKDFYMAKQYCRYFLVILFGFIAVFIFGEGDAFYLGYPMIICMNIPFTLIAYDERNKWDVNSLTMPFTRKQLVTSKYLGVLLLLLGTLVVIGSAYIVGSMRLGKFQWLAFSETMVMMAFIGLLSPSILLPLVFRFGAERGRVFYYITLLIFFAAIGAGTEVMKTPEIAALLSDAVSWLLPGTVILGTLVLILSWTLSVRFYEKREF